MGGVSTGTRGITALRAGSGRNETMSRVRRGHEGGGAKSDSVVVVDDVVCSTEGTASGGHSLEGANVGC